MFMLTPAAGVLLMAGLLALTIVLSLGVFVFLPRSHRLVSGYVTCPMLGRTIGARLVRDEWTRSVCRVVRCDALGGTAPVMCNQGCLRARTRPAIVTQG